MDGISLERDLMGRKFDLIYLKYFLNYLPRILNAKDNFSAV